MIVLGCIRQVDQVEQNREVVRQLWNSFGRKPTVEEMETAISINDLYIWLDTNKNNNAAKLNGSWEFRFNEQQELFWKLYRS